MGVLSMEVYMEINAIKELMAAFEQADIQRLEIKDKDFGIVLSKAEPIGVVQSAVLPFEAAAVQPTALSTGAQHPEPTQAEELPSTEVKSQVVGVFYASASPESAPYINVGDSVKKGQVLCIVEAMKMMNEITSPVDGEVLSIEMENGELVEYGKVLIRIRERV